MTKTCRDCKGTGWEVVDRVEDGGNCSLCENGDKHCHPCRVCNGAGQIVVETRRDDLTPENILALQENLGKPLGANPKDAVGRAKVAFARLPMTAVAHCAHAMMDGARKYSPFNWRGKKVSAEVYVSAAMRHLADWFEREETASDSGAHHLGHAMACCAILLDAQETGNLLDDRPEKGAPMSQLLERLNKAVLEKGLHLSKEEKK